MKMGEIICTLRRREGKTQEALAEAPGMSTQAVSRWHTDVFSGYRMSLSEELLERIDRDPKYTVLRERKG